MDLETENRLAALFMREAAELRQQAEKEGVLAYLRQPNKRHRPNSRFLTATVLGVQQANRAVDVNEMWRVRQKELELDKRHEGRSKDQNPGNRSHRDGNSLRSAGRFAMDDNTASASCSSKGEPDHCPEGLRDEELEMFLNSRTKRGRGAIGPRMDETGPYLPRHFDEEEPITSSDVSNRRVYGPERPASLKSCESSEEEEIHVKRAKKAKKSHSGSSDKEHSKKHKSKEKSRHKKRKEKRSKHRH
ncbi:AP-3 complex subunit delta-1-like [Neltuma alba]|uniref:AP-3 complex subunit delta-1-like n=1 Tax=Neltuma alba TaxID=207710 RepID=UPI0010A31D75|nr:AP-3 complex subunit delta-1-like [Prosopis alba]XP_028803366.1 AP-3 complex subunit delta-1-like [Prosopis alba]